MKVLQLLILFLFFIALRVSSQEFVAPGLEFACELKVTIDPAMKLGTTAHGERIIIPISGGTFEGPKMKGIVLPGGADYQYFQKEKGRTEIEAVYTIKTEDNVLIHVRNVGLIYLPPSFDYNKIYFRAVPKFEAPSDSKYDWLNNAIFICKAVPTKDYVSIQVWKVL